MPDVIDQLRSYGDAVEAVVPAAEVREPMNRRPLLLAVAALVLVACVGAGVWALRTDDGTEDDGPVVDTTEVPVGSGWQTLDPGPLDPREGAAVVWTGEELVVWGGQPLGSPIPAGAEIPVADGAAYNPATGTWRPLATAPTAGFQSTVGVWTGEEVLFWSLSDGGNPPLYAENGMAWNPTTDEWRQIGNCVLASPETCYDAFGSFDGTTAGLDPVWTGEEVIDGHGVGAYDPAADTWRDLPPRPVEGDVVASVWTGEELLVLVANRSDASYPAGEAVALSYSPAGDAWTALPPTGVGETAVALAWDGEQAVALDYEMQAATYDPEDGTWTQLPELPFRFGECSPQLARVGDTVLADHCSGQALLTDDRRWAIAPLPATGVGQLVSADDTVFGWASSDPSGTTLQSYTAPETREDDLALERAIPIGTVVLDLPDDARLTSTGLEEEAGGLVTALRFTIESGDVECELTSTYAGIPAEVRIRNDASTVGAPVERFPLEGVDIGRDEASIARFVPGDLDDLAHILLEESTSDVLDIACPDLGTTTALLERIHR